jgi:hypothetical protein
MVLCGTTLAAVPDSGSIENLISAKTAAELNLVLDNDEQHRKEFRKPDGAIMIAIGRVAAACSFAKDQAVQMTCFFYVFKDLTSRLIMGERFLTRTETLNKHRDRLHPKERVPAGPLQVCAFNNPRKRLRCVVESKSILANADTGSEVDLISLAYVCKRSLKIHPIHPDDSTIQFADGSTAILWGAVEVTITLRSWNTPVSRMKRVLYILSGLTSDVLFGQEFLNETGAFETYDAAFTFQQYEDKYSEINTITWVKTKRKYTWWTRENRRRIKAPEPLVGR